MTLAAGNRLGPYEVIAPLGAGGMGEVYRAKDGRLGREVAVKVLPEAVASDGERLRRFEQEARSASALNHPNIVTIYDVGQTHGVSWIAMELVEGQSLRQHLSGGAVPVKKALSIGTQIAEGLAKAHASGIVHRDLKPENVMVTSEGLVKILDFGLAKLAPEIPEGSQVATAAQRTEAGVVMGTVGYMSPEQATGKPVGHRSDQFALGAILYEMATGRRAFQGATAIETLSAILKEEPAPLTSVNAEAPEPLEWIVRRCLAKEPEERYHSTRDLARDLANLRDRAAAAWMSSAGVAPAASRRSRAGLWIGAAVVGAAAAAAVWFLAQRRAAPAGPSGSVRSIAILPFQNLGGRSEDEYFSDGMTESLMTDVAKTRGLLVIARNSAFRYKGAAVDVRKVGSDLGVRYVLEGSVQRSGESVRVSTQLIDTATGYNVWAEKYDRPMTEIFALQDEISRSIVAALKLALAPSEVPGGPPTPAPNLDAYDAYLRGMFYAQAFRWDEKDKAIPYLERAVALDGNFAGAHAALGMQYARKSFEADPERRWEEKAFVEIEKALAIDPKLADAYAARGFLTWTLANHFPHEKAAADFHRAIELNPSLGAAYSQLGSLYMHVGLLDKALESYRHALRIDPHDLASLYRIPRIHLYQQRYAEALAEFDATPEFRGDFQKPIVLAHLGREKEALAQAREPLGTGPHAADDLRFDRPSTLAVLLAMTGDAAGAREAIAAAAREGEGHSHFHHAAYNVASAYALMGKKEEAVAWLRRTADEGMPCYPLFEKDPFLNGLRGDAGFEGFMRDLKAEWERLRAVL